MLNAELAVKASYDALNLGGLFFCNDYVGRSRFQWSDLELAIVNGIRATLDDSFFVDHYKNRTINRLCVRPNKRKLIQKDPSEAADSEAILPAIKKYFSDAVITPIGGSVFCLCLSNILQNIDEESDVLKKILSLDYECIQHGLYNYALILAQKNESTLTY